METLSLDGDTCTFAVLGEGAYGVFRFEDGVHRAKRVAMTETLGRVHTSTATVVLQIIEAEPREHCSGCGRLAPGCGSLAGSRLRCMRATPVNRTTT
jgi:hypothetical protein